MSLVKNVNSVTGCGCGFVLWGGSAAKFSGGGAGCCCGSLTPPSGASSLSGGDSGGLWRVGVWGAGRRLGQPAAKTTEEGKD